MKHVQLGAYLCLMHNLDFGLSCNVHFIIADWTAQLLKMVHILNMTSTIIIY